MYIDFLLAWNVESLFTLPQVFPQGYLLRLRGGLQVGKGMAGRLKSLGGVGNSSSSIIINGPS